MLLLLNSVSERVHLFWKLFLGMKYKVTGDSQQGFIKENHTWPLDYSLLQNLWLCEWGKSNTGLQKTFNSVSDSILSWTERWIIWGNYNVAEKLPYSWQRERMVASPVGVWLWMSSFRDWYGIAHVHFCLSFIVLSDIFINDQDIHTDEPQEVQQREMPNPYPTLYYRLGPTRAKQICRTSWGILEGVNLNISQQCNLETIQAAYVLHYIRKSITCRVCEIILLSDKSCSQLRCYAQTLVLLQERRLQIMESRISLLWWWGCKRTWFTTKNSMKN